MPYARTEHDAEGQPLVQPRDDRGGRAGGRPLVQRQERDRERREKRRLQQLILPAEPVPGSVRQNKQTAGGKGKAPEYTQRRVGRALNLAENPGNSYL